MPGEPYGYTTWERVEQMARDYFTLLEEVDIEVCAPKVSETGKNKRTLTAEEFVGRLASAMAPYEVSLFIEHAITRLAKLRTSRGFLARVKGESSSE